MDDARSARNGDGRTLAGSNTLFTSNCEDGLRATMAVTNVDGAFGGNVVKGKLAWKCRAVAPRAIWYARRRGDAVLLYEQPPQAFLDYVGELYGHPVTVLAPTHVTTEPLDLFSDILRDPRLVTHLQQGVHEHGWTISPFIRSRGAVELARRLGTELEEGSCPQGSSHDFTEALNDKALFATTCKKLGIMMPETVLVQGWRNLRTAIIQQRGVWGDVMVRLARSAGGLGNLEVRRNDDLETQLEKVAGQPGWDTNVVVLTPLLPLAGSPSSLAYIDRRGQVRLVTHTSQIVKDAAHLGSIIPPNDLATEVVDEMRAAMSRYALAVAAEGGRGYVNIDWLHGQDGQLYGCESNYRTTAAVHPWVMRDRLRNGHQRIARSYDSLHVSPNLKFDTMLEQLRAEGLAFDKTRAKGVIVSIPPAVGATGYVILAEHAGEAAEMAARVHALFEDHH